jgi:hypothetical protein
VPSDKLTRREVDFVLPRAAEIDTQSPTRNDRATDETLSVGELVRLGEEAGLRGEAVEMALTELRRGAPLEPEESGTLARTLGASRVVVSRVVAAPIDVVRRAVDRFLREQLMTIRRHHGDRIEWERAQGIWPGLVRSAVTDLAGIAEFPAILAGRITATQDSSGPFPFPIRVSRGFFV